MSGSYNIISFLFLTGVLGDSSVYLLIRWRSLKNCICYLALISMKIS